MKLTPTKTDRSIRRLPSITLVGNVHVVGWSAEKDDPIIMMGENEEYLSRALRISDETDKPFASVLTIRKIQTLVESLK